MVTRIFSWLKGLHLSGIFIGGPRRVLFSTVVLALVIGLTAIVQVRQCNAIWSDTRLGPIEKIIAATTCLNP